MPGKTENLQAVKRQYGIIATDPAIDRAIHVALQVASTDLTVLINGESGVGKENFPKIIHDHSAIRKHGQYVAINCGAIPEGTVDSELFGHEKGAFTGAVEARKGYFEQADGGTIFLDEVGELPASTQARLLRVLETGEFMRVGSSKVQKTDVRVVAATNVNIPEAIAQGKFREDLYYRLNTVPIVIPPLRDRKEDILLLFAKFAADISEKYRMPPLELTPDAEVAMTNYYWPGNVRQLKNVTEQIAIVEQERLIDVEILKRYIDVQSIQSSLPVVASRNAASSSDTSWEREIIFKYLSEMHKDITELKRQMARLSAGEKPEAPEVIPIKSYTNYFPDQDIAVIPSESEAVSEKRIPHVSGLKGDTIVNAEIVPDSYSLSDNEKEMIQKALSKNNGRRKDAAKDLGISERTLYRKIKLYQLDVKL